MIHIGWLSKNGWLRKPFFFWIDTIIVIWVTLSSSRIIKTTWIQNQLCLDHIILHRSSLSEQYKTMITYHLQFHKKSAEEEFRDQVQNIIYLFCWNNVYTLYIFICTYKNINLFCFIQINKCTLIFVKYLRYVNTWNSCICIYIFVNTWD